MRTSQVGKARIGQLEQLVDELIKDHPEEKRVRSLMEAAGIRYSEDTIERMDLVLSALKTETAARPASRELRAEHRPDKRSAEHSLDRNENREVK